jgi:ubiquinone/menaquinone biosynthesis C-methylase UbiE
MTEQAARFVGTIPENYDRGLGPVLFADWAVDVARQVARFNPESVLELAAGTGIVTRALRDELAHDCELVATDLNPPMLEVAQTKFQPDEAVKFEQADATDLQYENDSFDFVICQFGVMFFPDKKASHADVLRVLKPGGTYLFTLWDSFEANTFAGLIHETVAQFFPDDPPGFYKVPYGYHDADEIRSLVSVAGFPQVTVERTALNAKITSAKGFAEGLVFGNPLHEEVVERGGDPAELCAVLEKTIRRDIGDKISLKILKVQATKG